MGMESLNSISIMQAQPVTITEPTPVTKVSSGTIEGNAANSIELSMNKGSSVEPEKQRGNGRQSSENQDQNGQANNEALKKAIEDINKNLNNSKAIFGFHEATQRLTIKIVDKDTKEVLKELPPEKALDLLAKVWEEAGFMVDEKR
ncbi:MAG: flagellar protein FlaG [Lachnospiraceae bacterium]